VPKGDITVELVERLVASQFPQWAGLPVTPVELDGWDNTTFRLGPALSVRLPSADAYAAQVDKEQRWLPVLAPRLPVPSRPRRGGASPARCSPGRGPCTAGSTATCSPPSASVPGGVRPGTVWGAEERSCIDWPASKRASHR